MRTERLEQPPPLPRLYLAALSGARSHRGDRLPDRILEIARVPIAREHLSAYARVCGFRESDIVPATYPHVLAFPVAMMLMVDPQFPFPLAGLVHIANRITQRRALTVSDGLTLSVRASDLRDHPRGRQVDIVTEAVAGADLVWGERSTYLHRERRANAPPASSREAEPAPPAPTAVWHVSGAAGRRYAAVSGDVNPIHLNPLAARVFGFRRAIAHGMWVKARCLSALEGRLPEAMTITVDFTSPVSLPSTVAFSAVGSADGWAIAVFDPGRGRVELLGSIDRVSGVPAPA